MINHEPKRHSRKMAGSIGSDMAAFTRHHRGVGKGEREVKITRANKTHTCELCGCNIYKGQQHKSERVYLPVKYDYEWESKTGGYTETVRQHEHRSQCDLAIKEVTDYFFNNKI